MRYAACLLANRLYHGEKKFRTAERQICVTFYLVRAAKFAALQRTGSDRGSPVTRL
jgi:hypothetical protein